MKALPLEFDPEIAPVLDSLPIPKVLTADLIPGLRQASNARGTAAYVIGDRQIIHHEKTIPGPHGDIILSVLERTGSSGVNRPGIYFIHGGGMVSGSRFSGLTCVTDFITEHDAVCVSVEYGLSPERQDPSQLEECYAGLLWVGDHLGELRIDPNRLMIYGQSAGGGLSAGVALMARDRNGPRLCAQLLSYPMLDDRGKTLSTQQFEDKGTWTAASNRFAWECRLGKDRVGGGDVDIYSAPARAEDLSGLPRAFIDVGSAEVYRDENVAYAQKLWESGVQTELHVWPGACHAFDIVAPSAQITQVAVKTRAAWVAKVLRG